MLKHARPTRVVVTLAFGGARLEVQVTDDGQPRRGAAGPATASSGCASGSRCSGASSRRSPAPAAASASVRGCRWGRRMSIRLLIVDDHDLVRTGFRLFLQTQADFEVVGEAGDGDEAIARARELQPDVVLMDIRMPRMDGVEATARLVEAALEPPPRVLVLSTFDLDEYVFGALRAGAAGFLLKNAPRERLVEAIRVVHSGEALLSPSITRRLIEDFAARTDPLEPATAVLEELTPREREVLLLVARGLSNREIAERLVVTEATVKSHIGSVLLKLGLRDRVQAVVFAYEHGIVTAGR